MDRGKFTRRKGLAALVMAVLLPAAAEAGSFDHVRDYLTRPHYGSLYTPFHVLTPTLTRLYIRCSLKNGTYYNPVRFPQFPPPGAAGCVSPCPAAEAAIPPADQSTEPGRDRKAADNERLPEPIRAPVRR